MKKLLFMSLLIFSLPLSAQVSVSAKVNKTVAEVDDRLELTVQITGAGGSMSAPELPSIPNFNYYETSHVMQSINSDFVMVYVYALIPRFAGKAEIAPIKYTHSGKDYYSEPITINVFRRGETPANFKPAPKTAKKPGVETTPAEDIFLRAEVNKKEAYVGEQVTLNIELWTSASLVGAPMYYPPQITNMTNEPMGETPEQLTRLGMKSYARAGVSTALFGVKAGAAKISSARIEYLEQKQSRAMGLFSTVLNTPGTTESPPINITIKPLPKGAGKHFYNAVGTNFTWRAEADRTKLEAGEATTITFTLTGSGNLKTVAQPRFEVSQNIKSYDMQGVTNATHTDGVIHGVKTFKLVLVPGASGSFALAPQLFTYFDTAARKYVTLQSDTIWFDVSPSTGRAVNAFDFAAQAAGGGVKNLGRDISYIKESVSGPSWASKIKLNAWPFILIAIALLIRVFIHIKPQKSPLAAAKEAISAANTPDSVANALEEYISTKTGVSLKSNKIKAVTSALIKKGADETAAAKFEGLWNGLDAIKFSPLKIQAGHDLGPLKTRTLVIIQTLDKRLK